MTLVPEPDEVLLLHAALDDGASAAAFVAWLDAIDLDGPIGENSFRLLPLVQANLRRAGAEHALMGRLAGVHRHVWCSMQRLLQLIPPVVAALRAREIPVMAIKGLALGDYCYDSVAHRPMSDLDIMVPGDRVADATAVLSAAGWRETDVRRRGALAATTMATRYALAFVNSAGLEIDLHWRPVWELGTAQVLEDYWRCAVPMTILGTPLLRPAASHLLVQAILHGTRAGEEPAIRWIPDTAMIIRRHGDELDWRAIVALAREARVSLRLGRALGYLATEFDVAVPAAVLEALAAIGPGLFQHLETRLIGVRPQGRRASPAAVGAATALRMIADGRGGQLPRALLGAIRTRLPTLS